MRRRQKSRLAFYVFALILIVGVWFLAANLERKMLPLLVQLTEAEAKAGMSRMVSTSLTEVFGDSIRYDELVTVTRDGLGSITSVQTDMAALNRISARITLAIQKKTLQIPQEKVNVPLGALTGSAYLAAVGPSIPISIKSVGIVETDFKSEFDSGGVNQTRHRIVMQLKLWVSIAAPLLEKKVELTTSIPLAETVIVGKVPVYYVN